MWACSTAKWKGTDIFLPQMRSIHIDVARSIWEVIVAKSASDRARRESLPNMNRRAGCHRVGKSWSYLVALFHSPYDKKSRKVSLFKIRRVKKTCQETISDPTVVQRVQRQGRAG